MTKENSLGNFSVSINDYNPNPFCLIRLILDEAGKPKDWVFLYCNDALAILEGKSKEELIGHHFYDVFPNGSRKWLKYYYKAAFEGKPVSVDELSEEIDQYLHVDVYPVGEEGVCSCSFSDIKKEVVKKRKEEEKQARNIKELEEIREIIAASEMGTWNIYLIDGKEPTMEGDDLMLSLLGVEEEDLSPEELYNAWFSNIVPSYVQSVLDSVEKMEMVGSDENTYLWKHPTLGERYVRCGGTARAIEGGYVLRGYHYDVDQLVREEKKKDEDLINQFAIIQALSGSFRNVFLADLSTGMAEVIRLADDYKVGAIRDVEQATFPFDAVVDRWVRETVHPDDKKRIKDTLSIKKLKEVILDKGRCTGNYRNIEDGVVHYYQYDFRRIGQTDNVVVGFQIVDDIVAEQEARQKKERELEEAYLKDEKEHAEIIKALSTIYSSIILADVDTREYEIFNSVKLMDSVSAKKANFNETREKMLSAFVVPDMRESMSEFLDFDTLPRRLKDTNTVVTHYKTLDDRWVEARFVVKRRDADGLVKEVLYVVRDISEEKIRELEQQEKERHLIEARLQEEKDHAEMITSLSRIYSTIFRADIDTHAYDILTSVPLMSEVASTSGNFDDVKEKIIHSFMLPEYRGPMESFLDLNTLADRLQNVDTVTTDYKSMDGQWLQARFIVKNRDENGVAREILYVARDITDEKIRDIRQQEQLSHALLAAQQASKAKTTFLNSMSHDIRTPMNAIIGFTALAQTHIEDQALVQDYLAKISTSSTHLLSLINDILDMSRIESGTVKLDEKVVHIPDVLHDLRTMIQGLVDSKNLNLFIDTQDVIHEDVLTDKLRLNQVLLNIVSNAIKYTQPGGDVMIRLIEKPCSRRAYTTYEFTVKDNGIGMSKEFLGHIFETFSREYSSTVSGIQGTGLGMAITKNIVDLMGGDIRVESEEGKGSIFTVTIDLRLASEPVKYEPIQELLGARALVVDDDLNTCRSVSKMLRDISMRPDWTTSGKEAIVRAQDAVEMNDEYKAYIIDYLMPDMNGIETVRRIRKVISEEIPIIVLTAYEWGDFEYEAREAGVTAFVSKPIFMSELREVLTQPVVNEKMRTQDGNTGYDYSGKRVLLVEDNELNREIATALLEETGMQIDSVCDGDEAVATINESQAGYYDLILMDIQMPKMDGYTATREIRTLADNSKANIPIVAMTANAFDEDRHKAFEAGMNGHIIKPINIDAIAEVLNKIFTD